MDRSSANGSERKSLNPTRRRLLQGIIGAGVGSAVVVGASRAVRAAPGQAEWERSVDGTVRASPVVIDGTVFIGSRGGTFYAVDAATGQVDWRFDTDGEIWSSASVVDGTGFVPSRGDSVYTLAADTGALLGETQGGYRVTVAGTTVFSLLDDHSIRATDIETGEQLWQFGTDTEELVERAPAVADGTLLSR